MQLKLGAEVLWSDDGASGRLWGAVLNQQTRALEAVVVQRGWFRPGQRAIPVDFVAEAHWKTISFRGYPEQPWPAQGEAISTAQRIDRSSKLRCRDGAAASILGLIIDDQTKTMKGFVTQIDGRQKFLSAEYLLGFSGSEVQVALSTEELRRLPAYRPDKDLLADVEEKLSGYEPLRSGGIQGRATCRDGVVTLEGVVRGLFHRDEAVRLARGIEGVRGVENRILADPEIATAVAAALAKEPRTKGFPIRVEMALGQARLYGRVPEAARQAAEQIARGIPGVSDVFNGLKVAA